MSASNYLRTADYYLTMARNARKAGMAALALNYIRKAGQAVNDAESAMITEQENN